jgi:hypothetical protein
MLWEVVKISKGKEYLSGDKSTYYQEEFCTEILSYNQYMASMEPRRDQNEQGLKCTVLEFDKWWGRGGRMLDS